MEHITNNLLPQALMIGVEYDLFWTLNPKSLQPFIKAFELSQKNLDMLAWQSGMYIKLAIISSLSDKIKYPKEPFTHDKEIIRVDDSERRMNKIKNCMMERMLILNSRFTKEGELSNE